MRIDIDQCFNVFFSWSSHRCVLNVEIGFSNIIWNFNFLFGCWDLQRSALQQIYNKWVICTDIYCIFNINRIVISCFKSFKQLFHHENKLVIVNDTITVYKDNFPSSTSFPESSLGLSIMFYYRPFCISWKHFKAFLNRNLMKGNLF